MRIEQLQLIAFGPFTNRQLDFSQGDQGLHLVFGANEAGKSSALRALIQLLFGVPLRSRDNFVHAYGDLRIGGRLRRSDNTVIDFVRRKGQSKTLRAGDDLTPLNEDNLAAFLGGIDETHFSRLFAIGHAELVQGGEELVSGGGQAGQALFAAGSGLLQLRAVQTQLQLDCEKYFKPGGSKPIINSGLAELHTTRQELKKSLLPAASWQARDKALRTAEERLAEVQRHLGALHQEKSRLLRIRSALVPVARRNELLELLSAAKAVPRLPDNFGDQWRKAQQQTIIAEKQLQEARDTLATTTELIGELGLPDRVLSHAKAIEALQLELGSHLKAVKDRPQLETRMHQLRKEARNLLADAGPQFTTDPHGRPELPLQVLQQIQRLGKDFERWTTKLEGLDEERRKLNVQITALRRQREALQPALAAVPDPSTLQSALEAAGRAEPLQAQLAEERKLLQAAQQAAGDLLQRQSLWSGTLHEAAALPLPSSDTIDIFEERLTTALRRLEQLRSEYAAEQKALALNQARLSALNLSQEVPTENDLMAARTLRDQGWQFIRQQLENGLLDPAATADFLAGFPETNSLADAFAQSQELADTLADRLRREADLVQRKAQLMAEELRLQAALTALDERIVQAETELKSGQASWQAQWTFCGIVALTPREMRAWCGQIRAVQDKCDALQQRHVYLESQAEILRGLLGRLMAAMEQAGIPSAAETPLAELLRSARTHLKEYEKQRSACEAVEQQLWARTQELQELESRSAKVEQVAAAWRTQWSVVVSRIGLAADTNPGDAVGVLESLRTARTKIDEADILRQRIEGIDRDATAFERQVTALEQAVGAPGSREPASLRAGALNILLTKARQADSRRKTLSEQAQKAGKNMGLAKAQLDKGQTSLELLCRQADCTDVTLLPSIEERARRRDNHEAELAELEKQLRTLSGGVGVEALAAEVAAENPDGLNNAVANLERQITELEKERSQLDQTIGTERNQLAAMDGSARAAELAEKTQQLLARLDSNVADYARVKIAGAILAGAIERYREKNQGPLIARAGTLFAHMTLGSFAGVQTEYDEQGRPVLVGVRPDGRQVHVEGMSDGSADQLYLALRLATLEAHLQQNEPLPFVVDDILMRFDDRRAAAALSILAELSAYTQVIFFTHHQHLVELAQALENIAPVLHVHHLDRS